MDTAARQFVISEHTTKSGVHWDLMLEMDDGLWTWRLNVPPAEIKNKPIPAERIHDHPLRFLTYEGPVQNDTGNVKIVEKGTYILSKTQGGIPTETAEPIETASPGNSSYLNQVPSESLIFESQGTILKGTFTLSDNFLKKS
jgi:hypothetical protein